MKCSACENKHKHREPEVLTWWCECCREYMNKNNLEIPKDFTLMAAKI